MAFSKIVLNGTTLFDVTGVTVTENNLVEDITALGANGETVTGVLALPSGSTTVTDNGTYDITQYTSVVVAVPVASGVSF